jgi:hypothetical protein
MRSELSRRGVTATVASSHTALAITTHSASHQERVREGLIIHSHRVTLKVVLY